MDAKDIHAHAPYDRIIATASTPEIPRAWLSQLAPGGVLVGVLQPHLAMLGGLLKAFKRDEMLQGKIVELASFMELRANDYPKGGIPLDFRAAPTASFSIDPSFFQPCLVKEKITILRFSCIMTCPICVFSKGAKAFSSIEKPFPRDT